MKKFLCFLLCVVMMLPVFISCEKECEHDYVDGVCAECDLACEHTFSNGKCTVCELPCTHTFSDGVCSACSYVCVHTYDKGICGTCGAKNLKKEDLVGRYFKYAYFEVAWSSDTTDRDKEILRKKYNVVDDEQLFDEIHDALTDMLKLANSLGGIFGSSAKLEEKGFYFKRYEFRSSMDAEYGNTYEVKDNKIIALDETLYYEKDRIYTLENSEDFKGIAIKTVYVEVYS